MEVGHFTIELEGSKFPFGRLFTTPGVDALVLNDMEQNERTLGADELTEILAMHSKGNWGDVDDEDKASNDEALKIGGRLLSAYKLLGEKVWIITEADRSVTTVLLPEEY